MLKTKYRSFWFPFCREKKENLYPQKLKYKMTKHGSLFSLVATSSERHCSSKTKQDELLLHSVKTNKLAHQ